MADINLVLTNAARPNEPGVWKIEGPVPGPLITLTAAIQYVTELRRTTSIRVSRRVPFAGHEVHAESRRHVRALQGNDARHGRGFSDADADLFPREMRLVTARFLWHNIKYAILIIFIVAAALTSSADAWNQSLFAAPMIALYLISIGIAWLVAPRPDEDTPDQADSTKLKLVIGAMVIDQARNHRGRQVRRQS
jgi:hypothetical protein